eukprot:SAG31_NODE_1036_length_10221_cov_170.602326_7_plen_265_part_00
MLTSCLDWLCLHVENQHLPRQFASANRVSIAATGGAVGAAKVAAAAKELKARRGGGGLKSTVADIGSLEEHRSQLAAERADEASAAGFYLTEGLDGSAVEARVEVLDMQIAEIDSQLSELRRQQADLHHGKQANNDDVKNKEAGNCPDQMQAEVEMLAAVREQQIFRLAAFGFSSHKVANTVALCCTVGSTSDETRSGVGFADEDVVLARLLQPLLERRQKRVAEAQTAEEEAVVESAVSRTLPSQRSWTRQSKTNIDESFPLL